MRDLRQAASGGEALSDERLKALFEFLSEPERIYAETTGPDGEPWSEPIGLLYTQLEGRPGLDNHALLAARAYATRLDREGRRVNARAVLEAALERYAQAPYAYLLRIDLGALLRDEHEFGRSLTELRAARAAMEELRARLDVTDNFLETLSVYEAVVASELGAAEETLGMTDNAAESFEHADELASALDPNNGPSVYGGNLMYRLNLAINRERWSEVQALRNAYEAHPWHDLVPEVQAKAIRARFAIADIGAAFRGAAAPGAGESELRALIELGVPPDEELRATAFLAESQLDRGALEEARQTLSAAQELIAATQGQEPRRLHVLGLSARLLRADGAPLEHQKAFLLDELQPALEAFLAEARHGPLEEAGISLLYNDWMRAALCELFELELAVDDGGTGAERAFAWLARLHASGTFSREESLEAPSVDEVREALLVPGRGLLAFVPGRTTSFAFAFAFDESGLEVHRLGPAWSLDAAARRLEEAIQSAMGAPSAHSEARLTAAVARASEAFVTGGVANSLMRWRSLAVAGLDDFGYVPFEALHPAGGEALGTTHEVTHQPSIPVGVWLARRASERPTQAGPVVMYLGQGDPALGGRVDLATLYLDPQRLGGGAFAHAGIPCTLLGPGDLPGLAGALSGARSATFLAHGLYDAQRARPAGLLLAPEEEDGGWFAEALEGLPSPPLAMVAACGTDRAPLRRGDDGRGHLRACFFRAGSDCVAAATLALDLEATVLQLAHVNERLAAGDSVAAAFHAARRAPQPSGVTPVHAHLLHVFGAGDARPVVPAPAHAADAAERPADPAGRAWPWALAGAAGLLIALAARRLRTSGSRSRRRG